MSGPYASAGEDGPGRANDAAAAEAERTRGLVDPESLGAWLDQHGLPGRGEPVSVRFISGGASNEIFEVSRGGNRWALRRPPRQVTDQRTSMA